LREEGGHHCQAGQPPEVGNKPRRGKPQRGVTTLLPQRLGHQRPLKERAAGDCAVGRSVGRLAPRIRIARALLILAIISGVLCLLRGHGPRLEAEVDHWIATQRVEPPKLTTRH